MRFRRKPKPNESSNTIPEGQENLVVEVNFSFEHRNPQGKLLTTNKDLKTKRNIRYRLKRILNLA